MIETENIPHFQAIHGKKTKLKPLSTNLKLKNRKKFPENTRKNVLFSDELGKLTIEGLIDTVALTEIISEANLQTSRLLGPQRFQMRGHPGFPNFR